MTGNSARTFLGSSNSADKKSATLSAMTPKERFSIMLNEEPLRERSCGADLGFMVVIQINRQPNRWIVAHLGPDSVELPHGFSAA